MLLTKIVAVRAVNFSIRPLCSEFRCERFRDDAIFEKSAGPSAGYNGWLVGGLWVATMVGAGCLRHEVSKKIRVFFSGYLDAGSPIVATLENMGCAEWDAQEIHSFHSDVFRAPL